MTTLLLVDVETSGLDPEKDQLLEVGAVVYDTQAGAMVEARSWLLHAEQNAAQRTNRLSPDLLHRCGYLESFHAREMRALIHHHAEYVVAHNADFDRQWLPDFADERWLDTCSDIWPRVDREQPSLTTIALAYDVGVVRAHRAIEDVLSLAAVLTRVHELEGGLNAWLGRALEERVELAAEVPIDDNQAAKDAGFRWDHERQLWLRRMRVSQLDMVRPTWTFPTFDTNEPAVELIALTSYDEREKTKQAGFRWDAERKVWWRRVRVSQIETVRAGLGFRTRETT